MLCALDSKWERIACWKRDRKRNQAKPTNRKKKRYRSVPREWNVAANCGNRGEIGVSVLVCLWAWHKSDKNERNPPLRPLLVSGKVRI